jgi:predicted lipid-binding transport protein (Tim44 family)
MDGGFPYGDIIVIGAIAAFILLRYRAMLGENTGRDPTERAKAQPLEEFERVIQLPGREKPAEEKKEAAKQDFGALNEPVQAIRAIEKEFTPEQFLEGARGAFEMVLEAYTKADHDTLRMLLSPKIYEDFSASLTADANSGRKSEMTLIAITKAEIDLIMLEGKRARIAVNFDSEQVQLVRDKAGAIIEGDVSAQERVEDRWVFERNLGSNDPNWLVIET